MKKVGLIVASVILFASCGTKNAEQAETGDAKNISAVSGNEFTLETENSTLHWRGLKPSGEHFGTVAIEEGNIKLEDQAVTGGKIVIDLDGIVVSDLEGEWNQKLVNHLKSEDFFFIDSFPKAVFEIVSIEQSVGDADGSTQNVTGNLTMRGVTKSISFPASIEIADGKVAVKTDEFSIDRTMWGVNFKSKTVFAKFKDDFINDMINLKFDVVFNAA